MLSPDLMCIANRERRFVATNPAWQTVLGWPAAALDGMSFTELTHSDDLAGAEAAHIEVLNSERPARFVGRFRTSDGVYRWILWTVSIDPATELMYAVGQDVTTHKEDERRLARLAAIVSNSDDGIVSRDLDSSITTWNPGAERMYGYTEEEMIGQPFSILIPPERDGEDRAIIARVLAGETVDHFETVRVHKDGRKLDVSVSVSAIRDPAGEVIGASAIARYVSQPRRQVARRSSDRTEAGLQLFPKQG
jgi:PAS domain S-box-containing protein